jgi:hypothetical protein
MGDKALQPTTRSYSAGAASVVRAAISNSISPSPPTLEPSRAGKSEANDRGAVTPSALSFRMSLPQRTRGPIEAEIPVAKSLV